MKAGGDRVEANTRYPQCPPIQSDVAVRTAKRDPSKKIDRRPVEKGLYLELPPSGGKLWSFKYRFGGKEKLLDLGTYPEISLKDARTKRDKARKQLADGIDPSEHRKAVKAVSIENAANGFEVIAREWYAKNQPTWATDHGNRIIRRLERDVVPFIGTRPISDLKAPEVLSAVRKIEARGALETAHRALALFLYSELVRTLSFHDHVSIIVFQSPHR